MSRMYQPMKHVANRVCCIILLYYITYWDVQTYAGYEHAWLVTKA